MIFYRPMKLLHIFIGPSIINYLMPVKSTLVYFTSIMDGKLYIYAYFYSALETTSDLGFPYFSNTLLHQLNKHFTCKSQSHHEDATRYVTRSSSLVTSRIIPSRPFPHFLASGTLRWRVQATAAATQCAHFRTTPPCASSRRM